MKGLKYFVIRIPHDISYYSIKLFSLIIVIELLPDEAAQTPNAYVTLILNHQGLFMWLGFLIHAFPFEIWSQIK